MAILTDTAGPIGLEMKNDTLKLIRFIHSYLLKSTTRNDGNLVNSCIYHNAGDFLFNIQ